MSNTYTIVCISTETLDTLQHTATFLFAAILFVTNIIVITATNFDTNQEFHP